MLIITMKVGEKTFIGENLDDPLSPRTEVIILGGGPGQYRVGFEAPKNISILRESAVVKTRKPE